MREVAAVRKKNGVSEVLFIWVGDRWREINERDEIMVGASRDWDKREIEHVNYYYDYFLKIFWNKMLTPLTRTFGGRCCLSINSFLA